MANSKWNGYRSFLENGPMHESTKRLLNDLSSKLSGKKYWAIYIRPIRKPKEIILGGDSFVFVDAKAGNVLGVIRGK